MNIEEKNTAKEENEEVFEITEELIDECLAEALEK